MDKWDHRFFQLARTVATWSKDPEKKVGCVAVAPDKRQIVMGYNGFPAGVDDDARLFNKEVKNELTVHAEANCIVNAAVLIKGWTMYVTKAPCTTCATMIMNAGIAKIVCPKPEGSWSHTQALAISLLTTTNIAVVFYE